MLNQYPLWKNILLIFAVIWGFIYSLPNIYPPDPAVQISKVEVTDQFTSKDLDKIKKILEKNNIKYSSPSLGKNNGLIRFKNDFAIQLTAQSLLMRELGDQYNVALNLADSTPEWLADLGASPMTKGLDLSGGIHFLMEADTDKAIKKKLNSIFREMKSELRKDKEARYRSAKIENSGIKISFTTEDYQQKAYTILRSQFQDFLIIDGQDDDGNFFLSFTYTPQAIRKLEQSIVSQNLEAINNRVNLLGVSEPLVQQQGRNRIVVELPGVQDSARARKILGKMATLEYRMEAKVGSSSSSKERFVFKDNKGRTAYLEKKVIATGDNVSNAISAFDENGRPSVNVSLDFTGGKKMLQNTTKNVGRRMGVLFIETKTKIKYTKNAAGEEIEKRETYEVKEIISLATLQGVFSSEFRTTGLGSSAEANELALLLRAGALATPMSIIEERTVGPSLGADNIAKGVMSVEIGFAAIILFMLAYYRLLGLFACIALTMNLMLVAAFMSLFSATLTLPGIAGIVLTVGMAVDANVLIFARIREELRRGVPPQSAINDGFENAFRTILDANLTTLLVALILFAVGTGPVKGFAVTLSIGILTSMFTAIMGTRAMVNLAYGGRSVKALSIGSV